MAEIEELKRSHSCVKDTSRSLRNLNGVPVHPHISITIATKSKWGAPMQGQSESQLGSGVAIAFAARDVLGNLLSGVSFTFSKPFSVGDFIRARNVEGQVEEIGLHSTRLLNNDKCLVVVPNSFFSSEDFERIEEITGEVRSLLNNHPKVYMGEDKPRCSVSQFGATAIEILVTCNIQPMAMCIPEPVVIKIMAGTHQS